MLWGVYLSLARSDRYFTFDAYLGYLIIFGSIVAYTSFLWLMRVEPAGRVSTHAFVNPIVAVLLGWLIGGEALHKNIFIATPLIIISVLLMIWKPNGSHMVAKK